MGAEQRRIGERKGESDKGTEMGQERKGSAKVISYTFCCLYAISFYFCPKFIIE